MMMHWSYNRFIFFLFANKRLRLLEGPTAQYVKESEGRGARAKDNYDNPSDHSVYRASHWVFGIGASLMAGLIVMLIVKVIFKKPKKKKISLFF